LISSTRARAASKRIDFTCVRRILAMKRRTRVAAFDANLL
jgi:hypothetical protein